MVEIEFVDRDEDDTWSASKLKTINSCGRQFYYRYKTKVKGIQTPYLVFGKAVHKVIELIHIANDFSEEFWKDAWLKQWSEDSQDVDFTGYYKPMFVNSGKKMLGNYAKENQNINLLELESAFPNKKGEVFKVGRFAVRGIVDQVRRMNGGRLLVVDFKTSKYPPDPLILRADPQFSIYYHVVKQKYPGEDPLLAYYHLESGKMIFTNRDDNDVLRVEAMLKEAQLKADQSMFGRNIGLTCKYCPFITTCLEDYVKESNRGTETI